MHNLLPDTSRKWTIPSQELLYDLESYILFVDSLYMIPVKVSLCHWRLESDIECCEMRSMYE